jgi:hypothetical protein
VAARDLRPGEPLRSLEEFKAIVLMRGERGMPGGRLVVEDQESQAWAAEVRQLNRRWRPGTVPALPTKRALTAKRRLARPQAHQRPRQRRVRRTTRTIRSAASSRDGPSEPEPPLGGASDEPPLPRQDFTPAQGPGAPARAFQRARAVVAVLNGDPRLSIADRGRQKRIKDALRATRKGRPG